jgi:hypothetical protein
MKFLWLLALPLAALISLGYPADSMSMNPDNDTGAPADFCVEYHWIAGTVPPPYHYEYTIRISSAGQGELFYRPGYSGETTPQWTGKFPVTSAQLDALYDKMKKAGLFTRDWRAQERHIIGGSHAFMTATAGGKKVNIPAFVITGQKELIKGLYDEVRAMPPKALMDGMEAKRQEYMDDFKKGKRR